MKKLIVTSIIAIALCGSLSGCQSSPSGQDTSATPKIVFAPPAKPNGEFVKAEMGEKLKKLTDPDHGYTITYNKTWSTITRNDLPEAASLDPSDITGPRFKIRLTDRETIVGIVESVATEPPVSPEEFHNKAVSAAKNTANAVVEGPPEAVEINGKSFLRTRYKYQVEGNPYPNRVGGLFSYHSPESPYGYIFTYFAQDQEGDPVPAAFEETMTTVEMP